MSNVGSQQNLIQVLFKTFKLAHQLTISYYPVITAKPKYTTLTPANAELDTAQPQLVLYWYSWLMYVYTLHWMLIEWIMDFNILKQTSNLQVTETFQVIQILLIHFQYSRHIFCSTRWFEKTREQHGRRGQTDRGSKKPVTNTDNEIAIPLGMKRIPDSINCYSFRYETDTG